MKRIKKQFETQTRDDLIDLCDVFARHVGSVFKQNPEKNLVIEIGGHYASGKSLISDAVKAQLTDTAVENARWKRVETTNCEIEGQKASISFINARYDIANITGTMALKRRNFGGPVFISNRPPFNLGSIFPPIALPPADIKISVWFPESAARPRQLGPLKFGPKAEMGPRRVDWEIYEDDSKTNHPIAVI